MQGMTDTFRKRIEKRLQFIYKEEYNENIR
jgi:hypothetical protein